MPPFLQRRPWESVTLTQLIQFAAGLGLFFVLLFLSTPGFCLIIDHANLLFHEAGHPIIGIFNRRIEPYGGTIGQLVFPCILAISFWRKDQPLPFAASVIWFFENWLNISRYMADARAMELQLVGGGDHDWNTIFGRWNILGYDTRIANFVKIIGWVGIILPALWIIWRYWNDRGRAKMEEEPFKF